MDNDTAAPFSTLGRLNNVLAGFEAGRNANGDMVSNIAVSLIYAARDALTAKDAEIARLTEINVKLCADFNAMNQHGAKQDAALAAALTRVAVLEGVADAAATQLEKAHDDAFKQALGRALMTSDGRAFSCLELNRCAEVASRTRAVLIDAPERIFAKSQRGFEGISGTWLDETDGPDMVEYTRTDLIPAMLAEAVQRGARGCGGGPNCRRGQD